MSNKEIKLRMGFMDKNGNLIEIPENIQKHIEAREEFWADKFKDIDIKCGIVLERLEITEKALELACDYLLSNEDDELGKLVKDIYDDSEYLKTKINYFKTKAKEMMKSE